MSVVAQGVPILTRIGGRDNAVHPYFARRMHRLLSEASLNVTYVELAEKEHWWWDSMYVYKPPMLELSCESLQCLCIIHSVK